MSFADRALEQLRCWPALEGRVRDGGAAADVLVSAQPVVRLGQPDLAEVRLTSAVIQRVCPALMTVGQVRCEPRGDWIRMRLGTDTDVATLASLVSIAIQAVISPAGAPRAAADARGWGARQRGSGARARLLSASKPGVSPR